MKKYFLPFVAALTLLGCTKIIYIPYPDPNVPKENKIVDVKVKVNVPVPPQGKKNAKREELEDDCETRINDIQYFVYNASTGLIEAQGRPDLTEGNTVEFRLTAGRKVFYALVNAPKDYIQLGLDVNPDTNPFYENISTITRLEQEKSNLSDNVDSDGNIALVMVGHIEQEVKEQVESVEIEVKRVVCKIVLNNIKLNLPNNAYLNAYITITDMYLRNCVAEQDYSLTNTYYWRTPSSWYNKGGLNTSSEAGYVSSDFSVLVEETVAGGGNTIFNGENSNQTGRHYHVFYTYPNGVTTDPSNLEEATEWSARRTRLVIVATVYYKYRDAENAVQEFNETRYFVVPLGSGRDAVTKKVTGVLESNHQYLISLEIKSPGFEGDGDAASVEPDTTVDISPVDWTGETLDYEI